MKVSLGLSGLTLTLMCAAVGSALGCIYNLVTTQPPQQKSHKHMDLPDIKQYLAFDDEAWSKAQHEESVRREEVKCEEIWQKMKSFDLDNEIEIAQKAGGCQKLESLLAIQNGIKRDIEWLARIGLPEEIDLRERVKKVIEKRQTMLIAQKSVMTALRFKVIQTQVKLKVDSSSESDLREYLNHWERFLAAQKDPNSDMYEISQLRIFFCKKALGYL